MAYYNEPFKRRPKPWVGLVGSASKPTITRVLTSDGPLYSPIYETGQGLELRVPKYQPTTSRGRYSSTPQYDYTMDASAGGAAPTPFTRRKGGFKRVLKHLAAMESPGLDFGLEAKKSGVPSPWSPTNVAWSPVGGTMFDWKKKRTA